MVQLKTERELWGGYMQQRTTRRLCVKALDLDFHSTGCPSCPLVLEKELTLIVVWNKMQKKLFVVLSWTEVGFYISQTMLQKIHSYLFS